MTDPHDGSRISNDVESHDDKERIVGCNHGELGLQLPVMGSAIEFAEHTREHMQITQLCSASAGR